MNTIAAYQLLGIAFFVLMIVMLYVRLAPVAELRCIDGVVAATGQPVFPSMFPEYFDKLDDGQDVVVHWPPGSVPMITPVNCTVWVEARLKK